jgi:translocation and assembly module TamB
VGSPRFKFDFPEPSKPKPGSELPEQLEPERPKPHAPIAPVVGRVGATLVAVLLVIAFGGMVFLNNPGFHRYLLKTVERRASESLGVAVELQEFNLHLSTLSMDLYGVTIHGASPYANTALLQVEHIKAGIRIVSVLQRKWYFDKIEIDRPIIQVIVDKNGNSNLPKLTTNSKSRSNTSVFDLGIRHAVLEHGEVFYNDHPKALAADLRNVDYQGSFNELLQMYTGKFSYTNGSLEYGRFRPFVHDFEAQFKATPTSFELTQAKIASGATSVLISASLNNYSNPEVQAEYDATLDGAQLGQLLRSASVPVGAVRAVGTAEYRPGVNRTTLQAIAVNGSLVSRRLALRESRFAANVENIAAHYSLVNGDATLADLRADVLGGQLTAKGVMKEIGGNPHSDLEASVHQVSLSALRKAAGRAAASTNLALTGALNATASASWGKTLSDLSAKMDATIDGQITNHPTAGKPIVVQTARNQLGVSPLLTTIPLASAIHATYEGATQQIGLENSFVQTPQASLTMNGTVGARSSLAIALHANDLREIGTIADLLRTAPPGQSLQGLDIAGRATFQGNVQGSTSAPHLTGQLSAQGLRVNGTNWKAIKTGVDVSPSRAILQHADLEPLSQGRITLNASTGLTKWAFTKTSPIEADVNVTRMDLADIEKLAGQNVPVTGTLNVNLHVHGSALNPQGNGDISLVNGIAYEQPFQSVKANLSGTGDDARANLQVQFPAGSLQAQVSVQPKQKSYTAELTSTGIRLDQVQALKARNIDATGVLSLHANGRGTFDNPQLDASVQIPTLMIRKQSLSEIDLKMNVANHVANATLVSSAVNTSIQAKAKVELTGDYVADASLDTQKIALQTLLAAYPPDQASNVTGQTEVHATLHGPLKNWKQLEAHLSIPVLNAAYNNNIQLAAGAPIHVDYKDGIINLQPASIKGTDTDLQFEGSIPTAPSAPMSLKLTGTIGLQLAQLFSPDVRSSGQLKFNINSQGAIAKGGDLGGEIDVVDANFASNDLPVGLQHGNGVLKLTTDRVNISTFQGTIGGGTVTAQGGVAFRPGIQFDLGLAAKGVRALYPQGLRETADAYLRLTGTTESAMLGGTVNLSDLTFTPAFDLNSFIGQFSGGSVSPPSEGFSQAIGLNIAVHSSNNLNLVSRSISVGGSANLQVRGTASDPVLLGRVNLDGGDIIFNGNRFVLTGGTVQFVNPSETQPVVNVALTTTIQQYNINLRFEGPSDRLRTQYSSDPALPEADIINLLAFGETTEAAANSTASTDQTAESLVASQVSSQVTSRVSKIAGISQLSINPVLAGSNAQGPPGADLTIQQRVTGNLFVTFSTNVASTQSQTIQGQYQLSPKVAISATRDPNGGFALDTLIKKSW